MNVNEFIENFVDQFEDAPNGVTVETVFRELDGWSSLVALSVMSMIDDEYDVQIRADEMRNSQTIQDLINYVEASK